MFLSCSTSSLLSSSLSSSSSSSSSFRTTTNKNYWILLLFFSTIFLLISSSSFSLGFSPPILTNTKTKTITKTTKTAFSTTATTTTTTSRPCYYITSLNMASDNENPSTSTSLTNDNLIMVIGSANQDLTSNTQIIPKLGETVMGEDFATACGGKGGNQAVAAAALQLAPVEMVCRVGDDVFGENLLSNFRKFNVRYDPDQTILKGVPSGVASIIVDRKSGDNMIIVSPGANYKLTKDHVKTAIESSQPSQVVCQLEILPQVALEAMKVGKSVGATTVLNTAPAPEGWTLDDMGFYDCVDILILNESELAKVCETMQGKNEEDLAKQLLQKGIGKAVIVTLGARGAMVVEKTNNNDDATSIKVTLADAPKDLPARNEPVVNTVGAGDSFCGALVSYVSTGLSLSEAAGYACGVASMTVRKDGAQDSYPTYDELPSCLKVPTMKTLLM